MAAAGEIFESPSETFEIFDNADIKLPMVKNESDEMIQLTHGNYSSLMESKNREYEKQPTKHFIVIMNNISILMQRPYRLM